MGYNTCITLKMATLTGKVALVTGGAQGIGKEVCRHLLEEKVKVCFGDIDVERGEATLKELQKEYGDQSVIFEKLDVSDEDQFGNVVKRVKDHFGGHLDILINNAGIANEIDWKKTYRVNLFGVANGIELAHRHLCDANGVKGGTVINTASILGLKPSRYAPCYSASKCGVIGLTLTWGHEDNVKRTNVKVNAICPDAVQTAILSTSVGMIGEDSLKPQLKKMIRNGELLKPHHIAEGVIKILRDDLTRAVLVVSRSKSKGMYYYPFSNDDVFFEDDTI